MLEVLSVFFLAELSYVYFKPWNRDSLRFVVEVDDDSDDHSGKSSPCDSTGLPSVVRPYLSNISQLLVNFHSKIIK